MSATMSILGLYQANNSIFSGFQIPSGMDKNSLINELLFQCAEFEILYPDPAFMKTSINSWSKQMLFKWQKLYDTMSLEYDPISNYDRNEEWTDDTTVNPGSVTTTSQHGYNNTGFVDSNKLSQSGEDTSNSTRKGRAWGNIGVTSSQQLIESERNIADFNIYQVIIDDFKSRYCICIY